MTQAAALATRDGLFIAQVATNEGTRQNWDQLHQFNMRVENDVFLAFNRADQPVVLAGPGSPWRIRQVGASTPDWTMVVLELA